MRVQLYILLICQILLQFTLKSQSITLTFESGDIPTSLNVFDPACNGPVAAISFTLPTGSVWQVTSVDLEYSMTAQGGGWKSQQRNCMVVSHDT